MLKIKKFNRLWIIVSLAVCGLFCMLFMGNAATATYADEGPQETPVEDELPAEEETDGNGLKSLVDGFIARLKAKCGDDYETYYNAILAEWGSVEEYLLSLAGEPDDAAASGWTAFVKWLGEYAPIWGSILAVTVLLIVIVLGKKALNKVAGWATGTGGKFKIVFKSINKMYKADVAEMRALVKLLGENPRFEDEKKALEESIKEIESEDE